MSQPDCDKANAACVFWSAAPASYLRSFAAGETPRGRRLRDSRARAAAMEGGSLSARGARLAGRRAVEVYRRAPAASGCDPFGVPADLYGPLKGRKPKVPERLKPEENAELRRLLYRLDTDIGPSRKDGFRRDRAAILAGVRDVLSFWMRGALWIGAAGAAVIAVMVLTR